MGSNGTYIFFSGDRSSRDTRNVWRIVKKKKKNLSRIDSSFLIVSNRKIIIFYSFPSPFMTKSSGVARENKFWKSAIHLGTMEKSISRYLHRFELRERDQSAGSLFLSRGRSLNKKIPRRKNGGYSPPASFQGSRGRNNFSIVTSVAANSLSLPFSLF